MPRRSSGGRSAPRPRPAAARSPPPQTVNRAPPPATAQASGGGSMLGGIGSTIAQGMAFGTGSSIAHRAVDAVMGPRTIQHETIVSEAVSASPVAKSMGSGSCDIQSKAFQDSSSPPRTERPASRPRPAAARSRASQSSGRSAPRPRRASSPSPPTERSTPATTAYNNPPRPTVHHSPDPPRKAKARSSSSGDSLFGGIGDGMSFGIGDAIAHAIGEALFGPRTVRVSEVASAPTVPAPVRPPASNSVAASLAENLSSSSCDTHAKDFIGCLNDFETDISKCQFYMNMLSQCKKSSGSTLAA